MIRESLLSVRHLNAYYGASQVLFDLNFEILSGEVLCLAGRNGVGKSSTLKSLIGLELRREGRIEFDHTNIAALSSFEIASRGIAYCPDDRGIFSSLSTRENLLLATVIAEGALSLDEIFDLFPQLKDRLDQPGNLLSGGEQQMLAIARILRVGAKLLLLDEPSEGLAPVVVQQIEGALKKLKEKGFTILLVEQNWDFLSRVADRYILMDEGKILHHIERSELAKNKSLFQELLGLRRVERES